MKNGSNKFLNDLLSALVNEWGFEEVFNSLEKLELKTLNRTSLHIHQSQTPSDKSKKIRPKITPVEYVNKLDTTLTKKSILLRIAEGFEKKEFLSNASEIRHLLENLGVHSVGHKQRADLFRVIINFIKDMPDERIHGILKDLPLYGPAQLGPLSEAIREANTSIRADRLSIEKSEGKNQDKLD